MVLWQCPAQDVLSDEHKRRNIEVSEKWKDFSFPCASESHFESTVLALLKGKPAVVSISGIDRVEFCKVVFRSIIDEGKAFYKIFFWNILPSCMGAINKHMPVKGLDKFWYDSNLVELVKRIDQRARAFFFSVEYDEMFHHESRQMYAE